MPNSNPNRRDARSWTPLMISCRYGTPAQAQKLIDEGADLQAKDAHSMTPLAIAAYYNPDLTETLLKAGAKTSGPNRYDQSPLHHAARYGSTQHAQDALHSPSSMNRASDKDGNTALHIAARHATPEIIHLLLKYGEEIDARNNNHLTPLHVAARHGPPGNITMLLECGANPKLTAGRKHKKETPLMLAAQNRRHPESIRVLPQLQGESAQTNEDLDTPLLIAIKAANPKNVEELLNCGADPTLSTYGLSPLSVAYKELGRKKPAELTQIIQAFAATGLELSAKSDAHGSELETAGRYGTPADIQQLINLGVNPHEHAQGYNALLNATHARHQDNVQFLLELGVPPDPTFPNASQSSPLQLTIADDPKSLMIMADLLNAGANPNSTEILGRTPLTIAVREDAVHAAKLLLQYGANPEQGNGLGLTPLMIAAQRHNLETLELLLKAGVNLENTCSAKQTALFHAANNQRHWDTPTTTAALDFLIAAGADVNARDNHGKTILHAHLERPGAPYVELLLSAGANPNTRDDEGGTPLHAAATWFLTPIETELLVAAGADLTAKNNAGDTPLAQARKHALYASQPAVECLLALGAT